VCLLCGYHKTVGSKRETLYGVNNRINYKYYCNDKHYGKFVTQANIKCRMPSAICINEKKDPGTTLRLRLINFNSKLR
jgi:uncharacterized Fe-S cluster-containing radical SAM superfamily protein